jgi:hypothetical protein
MGKYYYYYCTINYIIIEVIALVVRKKAKEGDMTPEDRLELF